MCECCTKFIARFRILFCSAELIAPDTPLSFVALLLFLFRVQVHHFSSV